ncbi:DUF2207 family protein [Cryobacterium tagatosivorans]|uniref:DUF2207 domain-containing protein n=1 Tax=Cryobacterium tagatosivorans TaxID=1259199 RepID=A0A4R8UGJ1_9MICO|nr:DUF2207 domain-containing protein [Cryobacterium tagatosivorans]TFB54695.1 DUF2207 domain-containing protein [Cryobacterium tagatosivorans]
MTRLLQIATSLALAAMVALAAPVAAPLAASAAVRADVQDFTFSSFEADYSLSRDDAQHSVLRTVETFVAEFPDFDQNRGMIRAIPNDYDGVPLHTSVESVTDANDSPVDYELIDTGDFTELALGTDEYVHGRQTYVITYTQQNVVRAFADTDADEFYWDTNGTGFAQPFSSVKARVHVDPALTEFLLPARAFCYVGAEGATTPCEISTTDAAASGTLFTAGARNLAAGENLSVAIGFQQGTFLQVAPVAPPDGEPGDGEYEYGDRGYGFFGPDSPGFSPLPLVMFGLSLLLAAAALLRRAFGPRGALGRGTIIAQYSVPAGYNLLEAGDLAGRTSSAIAAQIVSFAVRGKVRILDYPVSAEGGDYTLQLLSSDGVDPQERQLLEILFPGLRGGDVRELGVTNDALARDLAGFAPKARRSVTARGWRARAGGRGGLWIVIGLLGMLVAGIVLSAQSVADTINAMPTMLGLIDSAWLFPFFFVTMVCLFVAIAAARNPEVLTDAGAEQRDYVRGMQVYLKLAEQDRFRMLQSPDGALRVTVPGSIGGGVGGGGGEVDTVELVKLYEKLLPYAVLWGVEDEWAGELAVYYEQGAAQPDWFVSQSSFNAALFATSLHGLAGAVQASETPTPAPSTWSGSGGGSFSGGSSGGGFSGGGGGGGGGGGR